MSTTLKHGDFTSLAEDYSKYREGYAPSVVSALTGLLGGSAEACDAVDVGAGTGIWSRMLAEAGFRSVTSVDPNETMRATGKRDSARHNITWRAGSGEDTGLPSASADLLTMASSFHWVDFDKGTREFGRVLRPGGWFVALWNPRHLRASPLLTDIEAELDRLKPGMKRVSSARQGLMDELSDRLAASPEFDDVILLEGRHEVRQTVEQYIGVWRSVNDVRVQLGEEKFERFLAHARERIGDAETVETTYLTRAWAARRATL
ncbi:class I SAM-dependent methyltransferase [Streptomyces sp. NPDC002564]|uniref:class I SAM-dependent methyltransferase n=1 Tax=Streptomyces sp. NPDC002564 TaxID=3364649 RepID=UPI00368837BC